MEVGESPQFIYLVSGAGMTPAVQQKASSFSLRKATNDDIPGILACLRAAFEEFRNLYTPDGFLDTVLTPETLRERLKSMTVFVAVNSGNQKGRFADLPSVVGTIACNVVGGGEGHLRGMAVLPELRGAGAAAELLSCAEEELRRQNCTRITLDTTEPLQRAMRFYEKCGYRRSGKVGDFFGMPLIEHQKTLL